MKTRTSSTSSSSDEIPLIAIRRNNFKHEVLTKSLLLRPSIEQCEICLRNFNNKYNYLIHNASHIIIPLIKLEFCQCIFCFKFFTSQHDLKNHITEYHPVHKTADGCIDNDAVDENSNENRSGNEIVDDSNKSKAKGYISVRKNLFYENVRISNIVSGKDVIEQGQLHIVSSPEKQTDCSKSAFEDSYYADSIRNRIVFEDEDPALPSNIMNDIVNECQDAIDLIEPNWILNSLTNNMCDDLEAKSEELASDARLNNNLNTKDLCRQIIADSAFDSNKANGGNIFQNGGGYFRNGGGYFQNDADILQNGAGILLNGADILQTGVGVLQNGAGILLNSAGILQNTPGSLYDSASILQNSAGILQSSGGLSRNSGGSLHHSGGTLLNSGDPLHDSGNFLQNSSGILQNSVGTLHNGDGILQYSGGALYNGLLLTNNSRVLQNCVPILNTPANIPNQQFVFADIAKSDNEAYNLNDTNQYGTYDPSIPTDVDNLNSKDNNDIAANSKAESCEECLHKGRRCRHRGNQKNRSKTRPGIAKTQQSSPNVQYNVNSQQHRGECVQFYHGGRKRQYILEGFQSGASAQRSGLQSQTGIDTQQNSLEAQQNGLKSKQTQVGTRETSSKTSLIGAKGQPSCVETQRAGIKTPRTILKTLLMNLKTQPTDLKTRELDLTIEPTDLNTWQISLNSQQNGLITHPANLKTQEIDLTIEPTDLNVRQIGLNSQETGLITQLANLKTQEIDLTIEPTDLNAREIGLNSQETGLITQLPNLKTQEIDLTIEPTDSDTQHIGLNTQRTDLYFQQTGLLSVPDLTTQETHLKTQETDLKTQETNLKTQETDLKTQQTDLKTQQTDLHFQRTGLITQPYLQSPQTFLNIFADFVKTQQTDLKAKRTYLKTKRTYLKTKKTDLKTKRTDLKTQQANYDNIIKSYVYPPCTDSTSIAYSELIKPGVYKCRRCCKIYPNRLKLLKHEPTHINFDRSKPDPCFICEKYVSADAMGRHCAVHHNGSLKGDDIVPKKCRICGLNAFNWSLHYNMYHETKPAVQQREKKNPSLSLCNVCYRELRPNFQGHSVRSRFNGECVRCRKEPSTKIVSNWRQKPLEERLKYIQKRLKMINQLNRC